MGSRTNAEYSIVPHTNTEFPIRMQSSLYGSPFDIVQWSQFGTGDKRVVRLLNSEKFIDELLMNQETRESGASRRADLYFLPEVQGRAMPVNEPAAQSWQRSK